MKQFEIKVLGIIANAETEREEALINAANRNIESMTNMVAEGRYEEFGLEFGYDTWTVLETAGMLTGMFYMGVIENPVGNVDLAKAIK